MVFRQIGTPCTALSGATCMGASDDARQIACQVHSLLPAQAIDLNLQVLGHELADDDCLVEQPCRRHALSEVGRKCCRARYHPDGIVSRHFHFHSAGSRRGHAFLDVDQAEAGTLALSDTQQRGVAKPPERAAALHPIGSVNELNGIVLSRPRSEVSVGLTESLANIRRALAFFRRQRPEPLA